MSRKDRRPPYPKLAWNPPRTVSQQWLWARQCDKTTHYLLRPWNPEQTLLLPPSPVDWLPKNHLVFLLLDLAAELDLEAIHADYRHKEPRGKKEYEPRM